MSANPGCSACRDGKGLDFLISMAFQPIVDLQRGQVFAHEALVRGSAGESAGSEAADDAQAGWLPEFVAARLALKRALLHKSAADADEQRRIAAIMRRATAEIEGGSGA